MTDHILLRRLGVATLGLLLVSIGVAAVGWRSPALVGGLALGFALGAFPFASWAWVLSRGLVSGRSRSLAVFLLVLKLGLYSGALYVCVTRKLVDPVGVMVGITEIVFAVCVAMVLQGAGSPAKEAA